MSAGGKCGESRTNNSSLVEAMLAEYGTLRQESLEAVGHRMTVMSFTFAAVGVIIGGLLTRKVSDAVAGLIAVLFVPQVSKAALLIWLGEYERSQRAGKWLAELEQRVNRALGADALAWETTLLAARRTTDMEAAGSSRPPVHMGYPYVSVVALLVGAGYTATALGTYLLFAEARRRWGTDVAAATAAGIAVAASIVELAFIRFFLNRWKACRAGN